VRFQGFIGPSYTAQSRNVDAQRCVNWFPEVTESNRGKEQEVMSLVRTPGLSLLATIGDGPIRGIYAATDGKLFVVSADKLYRVSSSWVATEIGTLTTSTGQVSMANNLTTLMVVDGTNGYYHTLSGSTLTTITDPEFLGATQVVFQDGYFVFIKPDSQQFFISGLNDVTFDGSDVASSEAQPDNIVAIISDHRDLWLFGTQSTEVFFNSGDADFPFERVNGAYIEHGCAAAFSVAKMNNTVYWLGKDDKGSGIVYEASGYQPKRISTHAVEHAIQGYGDISDAVAYTYQQDGHFFYVLNFSSADTTWVYDGSTGLWHERAYNNGGTLERHRADCHAFAHSTHVVGDYQNGKIYSLSSSIYSDNSEEIIRIRRAPHITSSLTRIFYNSFQLDAETGVGIDGSGQGTDPQAMLRWSDDGGYTWSNERWVSLGKIGQRSVRAVWRRLGASRDRVFELRISDPVGTTLLGAELEMEKGAS